MKHFFLVLLLTIVFSVAQAQEYFYGQIVYTEEIIDTNVPAMFHIDCPYDSIIFSFAPNYRKTEHFRKTNCGVSLPTTAMLTDSVSYLIYDSTGTNMLYVRRTKDNGILKREVIETTETETILGYECRKYLIRDSLPGAIVKHDYWVTPQIHIEKYEDLSLPNKQGVPLKMTSTVTHKNGQFYTIIQTAHRITPKSIHNELNDKLQYMTLIPLNQETFIEEVERSMKNKHKK